ncbi:GntR family transcriptional regulator [Streptomyces sp. NPDC059076]|uniref:GntR family transcriptional regulator n=1 Tax=unclassified Streptomyces TaxID=2593676 RepID=UPI0036D0E732
MAYAHAMAPGSSGVRPALDGERLADDLRQVRARLGRSSVRAAVDRDQVTLDQIVAVWAPVACQCRSASGSPAERARWTELVDSTGRDVRPCLTPFAALIARTGCVRDLLTALRTHAQPGPGVAQIATEIRSRIDDGTYPRGARLSRARIAADLNARPERVQLALADLAAVGVVERHGSGIAPADRGGSRDGKAQYIADRLRTAITTGLYPPGAPLPALAVLSRRFVTDQARVTAGLHLLAADGLLDLSPGQRPYVTQHGDEISLAHPTTSPTAWDQDSQGPVGIDVAALRAAVGEAKGQWRYHRTIRPEFVVEQWAELRAIAHHLLANPLTPCGETNRRWAALIATTPPPDSAALKPWHTAILAEALTPLLPQPNKPHQP